jgi:hypothetical protein
MAFGVIRVSYYRIYYIYKGMGDYKELGSS